MSRSLASMAMTFVFSSKMDLLGPDATQLYNRMSCYNSLFWLLRARQQRDLLRVLRSSFPSSAPLLLLLGISPSFSSFLVFFSEFRWHLRMLSLECSDRNAQHFQGKQLHSWSSGMSENGTVWHLERHRKKTFAKQASVVGTFSCIVVVAIFCRSNENNTAIHVQFLHPMKSKAVW